MKFDPSIIGKKFGMWTILSYQSKGKNTKWLCRCDCGTEKVLLRTNIKKTKSCGCKLTKDDLLGKRFGFLTVISLVKREKNGKWLCKCDCGKEKVISRNNLLLKYSTSCGCLTSHLKKITHTEHGQCKTPAYESYMAMKNRCLNPNNKHFKNWGGRGIKICERWIESFSNFFEDMGPREKGMSLERINNDKGYYKENCVWLKRSDQSKNRRGNIYVFLNGEKLTARNAWIKLGGNLSYNWFVIRLKKGKIKEIKEFFKEK